MAEIFTAVSSGLREFRTIYFFPPASLRIGSAALHFFIL
jgi:hypothetical protein